MFGEELSLLRQSLGVSGLAGEVSGEGRMVSCDTVGNPSDFLFITGVISTSLINGVKSSLFKNVLDTIVVLGDGSAARAFFGTRGLMLRLCTGVLIMPLVFSVQ